MMVISDSTCHLFTKRSSIIYFLFLGFAFLAFWLLECFLFGCLPSPALSIFSLTYTFIHTHIYIYLFMLIIYTWWKKSRVEGINGGGGEFDAVQVIDMMESCVPPGFRFHPTDEELVGYYLRKKVASQKIDLDVIKEIDLYRIEPWDLQERCRIGYEEQNEWYFFSHKDKKYPTGTRTNRATMAGFWKATGRDKSVYERTKLIGMRKTLVFYKGRAPNGQKTDWIMHEYRLETVENGPPQEEGWVVCRAFRKRTNGQTKTIEGWDRSYIYDEQASGVNSSVDPIDLMLRQPQRNNISAQNFLYKQEIEADNLSFMHAEQLMQLPQLESPSMPLVKKQTSVSLISDNFNNEDEGLSNTKKVTDWRAFDKFVASQLSQEERHEIEGVSSFATHTSSDMALLLLQNSRENERNKFNPFLNTSSSDCDIGICVFEK